MKERTLNQRLLGVAATPVRALTEASNRPLRPFAALAGLLLAGGLLSHALEERISDQLTGSLLETQRLGVERDVRRFDTSLLEAEASARRLGELISYRSADLAPQGADLEGSLERGPDGSQRSRRDRFQPGRDAGIRIPPGEPPSPEGRLFLRRAREITRVYGQGNERGPVANSWVLPLSRGLVMHWPGNPDFLYSTGTRADERTTPRLQYSSPSLSPQGQPRWTPPAYDPAARKWLISVVAPFYRDGRWAGSVGHDVLLSGLLEDLVDARSGTATPYARALYVVDENGRLLAGRNGLRSHQQRLPERYRPFLEQARERPGLRVFDSVGDPVIVAPIPTLSAYAFYRVDGAALRRSLDRSLGGVTIARNLSLALLAAGGLAFLWRERRHHRRLQELADGGRREFQEFVEALGRELRTPLSIVTGSLHRLLHHPLPLESGHRRTLDIAALETRRLRGLVDELLDRSRGALGPLALRSEPVDAGRVASRCCELARATLDRPVELTLSEPSDRERLTLHGDGERLQQAIHHLIEAADQAAPPHAPIHVAVESADGWLVIGVGDVGDGTGTGVSVARMLTEAMGGRISREGGGAQGSTLRLRFPLAALAARPVPASA